MTERFLTLSRGDSRIKDFLNGDAGDSAIRPLLLSNLQATEWTFEMVPVSEIARPHWMVVWLKALRPETLVLSLAPAAAIAVWLMRQNQFDSFLMIQTLIGVLALHAAVNLFNDYHDHVRGWDRVSERGGARVISRGWLRALDVKRAATAAFAVAMVAGIPLVFGKLSFGIAIALLALLAALEFAVGRFGLKYRGFAEIVAWFMFGPLLTGGLYWAVAGGVDPASVTLGSLFASMMIGTTYGSLALLILHLKNFERILADGRAGLRTWPVRAGFDASKTFAYFCLALVLACNAFVFVFVDPIGARLIPMVVLAFGVGPLAARIRSLESPVAGRMRGLHRAGLGLAWLALLGFVASEIARVYLPGASNL